MERKSFILEKKLIFDFSAETSYEDFVDKYKYSALSFDMTWSNTDGTPLEQGFITTLKAVSILFDFQYELLDDYRYKVNSLEYIIYLIFESPVMSSIDIVQRKIMRDLFRYDVKEIYWTKQAFGQIMLNTFTSHKDVLMDVYMYLNYIKVNSLKKFEKIEGVRVSDSEESSYRLLKQIQKQNLGKEKYVNPIIKGCNKIHYNYQKEKKYNLHYLIYCVLFLAKDLYLLYSGLDKENVFTIVDEDRLTEYLDDGCIVVNISTIVYKVFRRYIGEKEIKAWEKTRSRKKLFQDIKEITNKTGNPTIQVSIKDRAPDFMSGKRKSNNPNEYKEFEAYVKGFGEVTKVFSNDLAKGVKAKKKFIYNQTKNIEKK